MIESLLDRRRAAGLEITGELALADPERGDSGLDPELETTVYRLVQEALTNTVKHARASRACVTLRQTDGELLIEVQDDGVGFDTNAQTAGFGLAGMRERVYLAGGGLELQSGKHGTVVRARLPTRREAERQARSGADQVAS